MKATGVIRKVDNLGRVVIPKELRKTLQIDTGTPLEIFVKDEFVILRKYEINKACFITGIISEDNIEIGPGKYVSLQGIDILNMRAEQERKKKVSDSAMSDLDLG